MPTDERAQVTPIAEASVPLALVLSVGLQRDLLGDRNKILCSAGYSVVPAHSLKEAVNSFEVGDFDLVVLCHSIPQKDRDRLACLIRATGSRTPIVHASATVAQLDPFADLTVEDVPCNLLLGIRDLLSKIHAAGLIPKKLNQNTDSSTRSRFDVAAASAIQPVAENKSHIRKLGDMTDERQIKVLVADDERVIADTLTIILKQAGFCARAVYSGEMAVEMALSFQPDMLVSDVIMGGITGVEAAMMISVALPSCKVLLFSGQAATADLLQKAREGGHSFELLMKPVHPKDLLARLRTDLYLEPRSLQSTMTDVNL